MYGTQRTLSLNICYVVNRALRFSLTNQNFITQVTSKKCNLFILVVVKAEGEQL